MMCSRRCFVALVLAAAAHGQTLAHPGWRGNGIAAEAWWRRAAIVRLPPDITFVQASATMDAMSQAGVDTMLLPDLEPEPGHALPFAERFGSMDDLDALLREASARRMHVLLSAPLLRLAGNGAEVRFWLTRGIAGFDVGAVRAADVDTLTLLRGSMDRFPGQRLLLVTMDTVPRGMRGGPVLRMVRVDDTAPDVPFVFDAGSGPAPATVPGSAVPMIDAGVIATEAGREQVRRLVAARRPAIRASRGRR